ncbi:MAG: sigma-70 family RNA polymerase sigma factor [Planctomycetota bacterium]|nr:MAG: sigma-70 family RNA polymerase sigma factor [Planctomycetota bacterium]
MAFTEIDRRLLEKCLGGKPRAWEDFVDRFMGLVVHVVNFTAQSRSVRLTPDDRDDVAAEVFLAIVENDFAILRHFRGESSLATYLTVVARRIVVRELLNRKTPASLGDSVNQLSEGAGQLSEGNGHSEPRFEQRIRDRDEVERLLAELEGVEADVVRLYHLEGRSYREISQLTNVPENTIGPMLSRARAKMRRAGADAAI